MRRRAIDVDVPSRARPLSASERVVSTDTAPPRARTVNGGSLRTPQRHSHHAFDLDSTPDDDDITPISFHLVRLLLAAALYIVTVTLSVLFLHCTSQMWHDTAAIAVVVTVWAVVVVTPSMYRIARLRWFALIVWMWLLWILSAGVRFLLHTKPHEGAAPPDATMYTHTTLVDDEGRWWWWWSHSTYYVGGALMATLATAATAGRVFTTARAAIAVVHALFPLYAFAALFTTLPPSQRFGVDVWSPLMRVGVFVTVALLHDNRTVHCTGDDVMTFVEFFFILVAPRWVVGAALLAQFVLSVVAAVPPDRRRRDIDPVDFVDSRPRMPSSPPPSPTQKQSSRISSAVPSTSLPPPPSQQLPPPSPPPPPPPQAPPQAPPSPPRRARSPDRASRLSASPPRSRAPSSIQQTETTQHPVPVTHAYRGECECTVCVKTRAEWLNTLDE